MPKKLGQFRDQIQGKARIHLMAPASSKEQFEAFITSCRGRGDQVVTSKTGARNGAQYAVIYTSNKFWLTIAVDKIPGAQIWN